jgi:hypothetical protein
MAAILQMDSIHTHIPSAVTLRYTACNNYQAMQPQPASAMFEHEPDKACLSHPLSVMIDISGRWQGPHN